MCGRSVTIPMQPRQLAQCRRGRRDPDLSLLVAASQYMLATAPPTHLSRVFVGWASPTAFATSGPCPPYWAVLTRIPHHRATEHTEKTEIPTLLDFSQNRSGEDGCAVLTGTRRESAFSVCSVTLW